MDYWDRLGWTDPFGAQAFTERQKRYQAALQLPALGTPQLLAGNRPVGRDLVAKLDAGTKRPAAVRIRADLEPQDGALTGRVAIDEPASDLPDSAEVLLVLYQRQAWTDVPRGENAGKALLDFYVVRSVAGPEPLADVLEGGMSVDLPLPAGVEPANLGLAVLVEDPETAATLECAAFPLAQREPDLLVVYDPDAASAERLVGLLEDPAGDVGIAVSTTRDEVHARTGRTFLLGFSTAAAGAIEEAAAGDSAFDGLLLIAPQLEVDPVRLAKLPAGLPVYMVFGSEDQEATIAEGKALYAAFQEAGLDVLIRGVRASDHQEVPERAAPDFLFWARTRRGKAPDDTPDDSER